MKQLCIHIHSGGMLTVNSGSVMHGILMDLLPSPWPEKLHQAERQLFSQWLEVMDDQSCLWHIGLLDDELADELLFQIQQRDMLYCRHINDDLLLGKTEIQDIPIQKYMSSYIMAEDLPDDLRLTFRTPTAHKSHGEYQIIPSLSMIAGSLQRRMAQIDPQGLLADPEAAEKIAENTKVIRYSLETQPYNLEGTRVFGYTGTMEIRFHGDKILRWLAAALFSLADWTGIGIKTALGMGGCQTTPIHKKSQET